MSFFEEPAAPRTVQRRSGDGYCPVCGQYGITALRVIVWDPQSHETADVCFKKVCLHCNKGRGRLIGLYTSSDGYHADFSLRHARLPKGFDDADIRRAVEKNPLQGSFTPGELAQYRRKDMYGRNL